MPWIEISEEELEHRRQGEVLDRIHEARARGDVEAERQAQAQLRLSPEVAWRATRVMGADWLRRQPYDLSRADAVFGPTWLDREISRGEAMRLCEEAGERVR